MSDLPAGEGEVGDRSAHGRVPPPTRAGPLESSEPGQSSAPGQRPGSLERFGDDVAAALAEALAAVRRRLQGAYDVDDFGFDRDLTEQVLMPLARPLYQRYWRVRTIGIDRVPSAGALLVANHSGTLPFDAVMTKLALYDEHPDRPHLRPLTADLAFRAPLLGPLIRKSGGVLAHDDDAAALLRDGALVGVWPEGFKGIGKPYRERYRLQRFGRGGFVEVALRTQVPIVPVAIVGAEEIYPLVANVRPLARLLGLPYFPITWQFPALGPLGVVPLPSRWLIAFDDPIPTAGHDPADAEDPSVVLDLADRVRDAVAGLLADTLAQRPSVFR